MSNKKKKDLYKILDVSKNATPDEIKKAYKKKAIVGILFQKWHPDKNTDKAKATEIFQNITFAYSILSDKDKKQKYDQFGITEDEGEDIGFDDFFKNFNQEFFDFFPDEDNFLGGVEMPFVHFFEVFSNEGKDAFGLNNNDYSQYENFGKFPRFVYQSKDKKNNNGNNINIGKESFESKENRGFKSLNEKKNKEKELINFLKSNDYNTVKANSTTDNTQTTNTGDWVYEEDYEDIDNDTEIEVDVDSEEEQKPKHKNTQYERKNDGKDDLRAFFQSMSSGDKTKNIDNLKKYKGLEEDVFKKFIMDNTIESNSRRFTCQICKGFKKKLEYSKIKDHFMDCHEKEYTASKYSKQASFILAIDFSDYLEMKDKPIEIEKEIKEKEIIKETKSKAKKKKDEDDEEIDMSDEELFKMFTGKDMFKMSESEMMKEMEKMLMNEMGGFGGMGGLFGGGKKKKKSKR